MPERKYSVNCAELVLLVDKFHQDTCVRDLEPEEIRLIIDGKVPEEVRAMRIRLLYESNCIGRRKVTVDSQTLREALEQIVEERPDLLPENSPRRKRLEGGNDL